MKLIEKNHLTKSLVWELPNEDVLIIRKYWVHYLSQALGASMAIGFAVALVLSNSSNVSEQMTLNELGSALWNHSCVLLPITLVAGYIFVTNIKVVLWGEAYRFERENGDIFKNGRKIGKFKDVRRIELRQTYNRRQGSLGRVEITFPNPKRTIRLMWYGSYVEADLVAGIVSQFINKKIVLIDETKWW
ncbi:MAG: hypothetical protein IPL28_08515 [Chloroflexi bacterium]|nr:hypothetical protein [Chloroflexota bacterium]